MQHTALSPAFPDVPLSSAGPVLVVGGGVAGMQAALDLARFGHEVILAERHDHLGGQVMRLDKVYPTDHCAFCPVWPQAKACLDHPRISVRLHTTVTAVVPHENGLFATLEHRPPVVNPTECVFCGLCFSVCDHKALNLRNPLLTWDPSMPPSVRIDPALCTRCGACAAACPTEAVQFDRAVQTEQCAVADVVLATGFEEPMPAPAPEFGAHSHPDICTAMKFEAWTAENRSDGPLLCPSSHKPARSVAFIQCAGARDLRYLPYCAAVCCMHAMKQARWLKRRQPELSCTVFYTDLRAPGKAQESYVRAAQQEGVICVRVRPGFVLAAPGGGIAVRHEDPQTGRVVTDVVDMAVLNGGLAQCPLPQPVTPDTKPAIERRCGFCEDPGDIAQSVIQAGRTAALVASRLRFACAGASPSVVPPSGEAL